MAFNIIFSIILLAAIVFLLNYAINDYNKKTAIDPDKIDDIDTTIKLTYDTPYVLAELSGAKSDVEIT